MLDLERLDGDLLVYLDHIGERFAAFDRQDSGCRAVGVRVGGDRWFVKHSVEPRALASLERARALHRRVAHPAIIELRHTFATPGGLALVYPWVDGELLYRNDRVRSLPVAAVLDALDSIFDAHLAVARAGFVAVDFYDGCLIYDFAARLVRLCDLDEYRPGPFAVDADRLPGSTRFMAPEERVRGAAIDERTTVFNLGRAAQVLLGDRGGPGLAAVARRATREDPDRRQGTVDAFVAAWRASAG